MSWISVYCATTEFGVKLEAYPAFFTDSFLFETCHFIHKCLLCRVKNIVHRKKMNVVIIYSPLCHYKPLWLTFFHGEQGIFYVMKANSHQGLSKRTIKWTILSLRGQTLNKIELRIHFCLHQSSQTPYVLLHIQHQVKCTLLNFLCTNEIYGTSMELWSIWNMA